MKKKRRIIDGNYKSTFDIRLLKFDTIIFLDYPTHISIWRAIKRRVRFRKKAREDMPPTWKERLGWGFFVAAGRNNTDLAFIHKNNDMLKLMKNEDRKKRWHLYALKLQDGKYYVGITSKTPEIRMQEHLSGVRVAYWTAKHKPIEIIHTEDLGMIEKSKAEKRENKMVRALMKQRGLNNVRGGDLTSVEAYIKRFGYVWNKERWLALTGVVLLLLIIAYLALDKYFL